MNETISEIIIELYKNPINKGKIEEADIIAEGGNPVCGDQGKVYLKIEDDKIKEAKFLARGCAISIASMSILTELIKNKTLKETLEIKPETLFKELGNIIQTRQKCALLSLTIIKEGIKEYMKNKKKVEIKGIKI
ncbi:MAG: iron-sulfur cluster assembly scaffold protein [Candidatus Diapherotrites archaeon]